ncbi:MAG: phosphoenolpyruvate--protein phosphotransferase [Opitutia bacterium TMED67]|nr:phosphoenolpyruvate--protein phosphotransferase [Verrucomicrobiales bacterium]OUU72104.1 MAG: phosphoenolpyruvate--protein phosphotransferase [Opitutae bacterium TMED67]RZO61120.1 MAG: phosphoenolpyruvate--protein phosphotransferase [Limisphaerales bacterium]
MSLDNKNSELKLRGIPVSEGVSRGRVVVLNRHRIVPAKTSFETLNPEAEEARFLAALDKTRQQILEIQKRLHDKIGAKQSLIFDAHLLVLEDPAVLEEVNRKIREEKLSSEYALYNATEKYAEALSAVDDSYLSERAADIRDVIQRVLGNLTGQSKQYGLKDLTEPCIIVANDLTPSDTANLDSEKVLGFITEIGSKTSHTAILARSLQIPAVLGLGKDIHELKAGQSILLDGFNGFVVISPSDQLLFEYGQLVKRQNTIETSLQKIRTEPAKTLDNHSITLSANIERATDVQAVLKSGATGVGLFRTEFLFINRTDLPDEEEQFQSYKKVSEALNPEPVIIRTLDLGGDKLLSHVNVSAEMNPFLGWRAIRLCLQEKDLFRTQLRAILRASAFGNLKIMYPMISGIDELDEANNLLEECQQELRVKGEKFSEKIEIGVMIETPSAAMISDKLAKRVHFFSIGTNDLIQYALAVDRLNEKIAHLYEPTHPGILRLIKTTVDAGKENGIWTGVCGEMASDLSMVPLLIGLGVEELSVASSMVPRVKMLIRNINVTQAKELADFALSSDSPKEILRRAKKLSREAVPNFFETKED